jgi:hypothetical protein
MSDLTKMIHDIMHIEKLSKPIFKITGQKQLIELKKTQPFDMLTRINSVLAPISNLHVGCLTIKCSSCKIKIKRKPDIHVKKK